MLKLLLTCFKNRQINLFIIVGIILVLFPDKISETAPYIVGIALIVHAALNAFILFRSPKSDISLGGAVVSGGRVLRRIRKRGCGGTSEEKSDSGAVGDTEYVIA